MMKYFNEMTAETVADSEIRLGVVDAEKSISRTPIENKGVTRADKLTILNDKLEMDGPLFLNYKGREVERLGANIAKENRVHTYKDVQRGQAPVDLALGVDDGVVSEYKVLTLPPLEENVDFSNFQSFFIVAKVIVLDDRRIPLFYSQGNGSYYENVDIRIENRNLYIGRSPTVQFSFEDGKQYDITFGVIHERTTYYGGKDYLSVGIFINKSLVKWSAYPCSKVLLGKELVMGDDKTSFRYKKVMTEIPAMVYYLRQYSINPIGFYLERSESKSVIATARFLENKNDKGEL